MADFVTISTQEQFDAAIGERIKRERESAAKKYADYDDIKAKNAAYEAQIAKLTSAAQESAKKYQGVDDKIASLTQQVHEYETASVKTRIAHECGLPYEMASRLRGETEEEFRADAKVMAQFLSKPTQGVPLRTTEQSAPDNKRAALLALNNQLQKGE